MEPTLALVYQNLKVPFALEAAAEIGVPITLIHDPASAPPRDLPAVVRTVALDIFTDQEAAIEQLRQLHRETPLRGIVTFHEPAVIFTAKAAAALGLRGLSAEVAHNVRDKGRMRACFQSAGLNCPYYVTLAHPNDFALAEVLELPVIVKPSSAGASIGVVRADTREALRRALAEVREINEGLVRALVPFGADEQPHIIVEEYIDGPEYAVESFSQAGRVHILMISYKGQPQGPYFEELGPIAPAPLEPAVREALVAEVRRAVLALGITDGPAHTELRLRNGRKPYVLEVAARLGGAGASQFVVRETTGVNISALTLLNACGPVDCSDLPDVAETHCAASVYIVPVHGHGTIAALEGLEELRAHPSVRRVLQFMRPGAVVEPYPRYPGYPAFVLATHRTFEEGLEWFAHLDRTVQVRYEEQLSTITTAEG